jgi:hypothetical protein
MTELVGKMYADQGVSGFYRGVQVNILRACVLSKYRVSVRYIVDYSFVHAFIFTNVMFLLAVCCVTQTPPRWAVTI